MAHNVPHLRLYAPDSAESAASDLAARELLRPAAERDNGRGLEPLSRAWFEEIEQKRFARVGEWLPRALEFSRHRDESLVMLGPGLGSDALQYLRHDTAVTMAVAANDAVAAIRRNFSQRGLEPNLVAIETGSRLPFPNGQFDLAYLNLLHDPTDDPSATIAELYRVLKPGGKLFALAPARYDVDFWRRRLYPVSGGGAEPLAGPKRSAREMRQFCAGFERFAIIKRQLRRSELPHLWRVFPLNLVERLAGRVLALRATKPVRAAMSAAIPSAA